MSLLEMSRMEPLLLSEFEICVVDHLGCVVATCKEHRRMDREEKVNKPKFNKSLGRYNILQERRRM